MGANPYAAPAAPAAAEGRKPVSKAALLLLTLFFGGIGAHKFYLGKTGQGVLYLVFFWTWIPALVALVELLVYAFTGSARLNEKYSAEGSAAVVALVILAFVGLAGLLAAIAIPAYSERANRSRAVEAMMLAQSWQPAVEEHFRKHGKLPQSAAELQGAPPEAESRYARIALGPEGS